MSPGWGLPPYQVVSWCIQPFGHYSRLATIDMGRKLGAVPLFLVGSWVPIQHKVTWAKAYLHTKWHLNPSSRLTTTDMGRKLAGAVPLLGGELDPHLTQCGLGRGLPPCQVSFWSIQPFGHSTLTSQTDRTDMTGQWSDSIGWTILKMVDQ